MSLGKPYFIFLEGELEIPYNSCIDIIHVYPIGMLELKLAGTALSQRIIA